LRRLFQAFMENPSLLPPDFQTDTASDAVQARRVADYIASMTDHYAMREYRRLFEVTEV
jgi:dGTPase